MRAAANRTIVVDSDEHGPSLDITGAEHVEVQVSTLGDVLWVNVGNVCKLRICRIVGGVTIKDEQRNNDEQN